MLSGISPSVPDAPSTKQYKKSASVHAALSSLDDNAVSNSRSSCDETVLSSTSFEERKQREEHIDELLQDRKWRQVENLLKQDPKQATQRLSIVVGDDVLRALPLHALCALDAVPLSVIQVALAAHPEAAQVPDSQTGMLPLHLACKNRCFPLSAIEELVKVYAEGARTPNKAGSLPLHYASNCLSSSQAVDLLLKVHPTAVRVANDEGNLPLHTVCSRSSVDNTMVRLILKAYPEATQVKNKKEQLPLHCACFWRNPTFVIAALVHEYPEAVIMGDASNDSPQDLLTARRPGGALEYSLPSDPRFHILQSAHARVEAKQRMDSVQKPRRASKLQVNLTRSIRNLMKCSGSNKKIQVK
jgi:hypothetical protein